MLIIRMTALRGQINNICRKSLFFNQSLLKQHKMDGVPQFVASLTRKKWITLRRWTSDPQTALNNANIKSAYKTTIKMKSERYSLLLERRKKKEKERNTNIVECYVMDGKQMTNLDFKAEYIWIKLLCKVNAAGHFRTIDSCQCHNGRYRI